MKNELSDFEKRKSIRNLVGFLEKNKEIIKTYENLELFRQHINDLYISVKNASYDSIEFDIPENLDIHENNSYYYYFENNRYGVDRISIISKKLEKFYFLNVTNDVDYKLIKYCKDENNMMIVYKKNNLFTRPETAERYKSLVLKSIINTKF